jgi:hypothetical protein
MWSSGGTATFIPSLGAGRMSEVSSTSPPLCSTSSPRGCLGPGTIWLGFLHEWFQASAAMYMTFALFWDIAQSGVVIPYIRFGTSLFHSHGCQTWGWDRKVGLVDCPERPYGITSECCIISEKSTDLRFRLRFYEVALLNSFGVP